MFIQIAILIIVIIGAVHVVYQQGVKAGKQSGIDKGRMQILEENIQRADILIPHSDRELIEAVDNIQPCQEKIEYSGKETIN